MSSFLDVPGIKAAALDGAVTAELTNPGSASRALLDGTYVTFVDSVTGLPLVGKHVIITVDQTTDDIADIVVEDI